MPAAIFHKVKQAKACRDSIRQITMQNILLSNRQIEKHDIDTIKRFIRARIGGYTLRIGSLRPMDRLYRAVLWRERPVFIGDLSYPPVEKTQMGRANRQGRPMFYCSASPLAPIYEIGAKAGDCLALSEWTISEPLWAHNLGYHPTALDRIGAQPNYMRSLLLNPIPDENEFNEKLRRAMSMAFTEEVPPGAEYKYKRTVAINELLFDRASPIAVTLGGPQMTGVAGTAYPAMKLRGDADNLAIIAGYVDQYLKIVSVRYIQVEEVDERHNRYSVRTLCRSMSFYDGKIVWGAWLEDGPQHRTHAAFEHQHWVLRDGSGRIYDYH